MGENRSQTSRQRVTVAQASEILGITIEAVRGRIKRGMLEHERHSGTVYVLLHADQMPAADNRATTRLPTGCNLPAPRSYLRRMKPSLRYETSSKPSARPTPKHAGCSRLPWSGSRPQ